MDRLYSIWGGMKSRCCNEKHIHFDDYGGRGIQVCDEWKNSFETFRDWALSHGYSDELTLDRIDANKDYEPSNCRWATRKEQQNNRRNNIIITYNGKTQTLAQWAEEVGINYHKLLIRISRGWSAERALSEK